jgi:hypothetical protein
MKADRLPYVFLIVKVRRDLGPGGTVTRNLMKSLP